jgi:hypothetical protein
MHYALILWQKLAREGCLASAIGAGNDGCFARNLIESNVSGGYQPSIVG